MNEAILFESANEQDSAEKMVAPRKNLLKEMKVSMEESVDDQQKNE